MCAPVGGGGRSVQGIRARGGCGTRRSVQSQHQGGARVAASAQERCRGAGEPQKSPSNSITALLTGVAAGAQEAQVRGGQLAKQQTSKQTGYNRAN
jgi:hypothetical protein